MNKNVKINNPMKVITGPDTRWSYANVWEPKSINGGTPKYSVSLIIPKSDTKTSPRLKLPLRPLTRRARPSSRAMASLYLPFLSSRRRFVMATWSVRTIRPTPMLIS